MTGLLGRIVKILFAIVVFTASYQWWRPLPDALLPQVTEYNVPDSSVRFYADYTYIDKKGERKTEQAIWPRIFTLIDNAEHYMLFDFSLFNDFQSATPETTRALSKEFAQRIVEKLATDRHIAIQLITDPVNTLYGGVFSAQQTALRKSGVVVIETDLSVLRDPNLIWSSIWRPFFSWWGNSTEGGWLPHPLQAGGSKVTLRSWANLLNWKWNDRNIMIIGQSQKNSGTQKIVTFVTSGSPRDASSADGNVALEVRDAVWKDATRNEAQVADVSGGSIVRYDSSKVNDETGHITVSLLTETKIRDAVLGLLSKARQGDTFDLAMPYLSERKVIQALIDASNKGATIRVLLDPHKATPEHDGHGIPNGPVSRELTDGSQVGITVRWCDTHGETCNAKYFAGHNASSSFIMVGSANFTRRDLNGFDLNAAILATSNKPFTAWEDGKKYFNRQWNNEDGAFTLNYERFLDNSVWRASVYRMMERTGLGTF